MKVEIKTVDVIVSHNDDGKKFEKQMCLFHSGGNYPLPFQLSVPATGPYQPGWYRFSDESFRQNRYGGLEFAPFGMSLVPIKA